MGRHSHRGPAADAQPDDAAHLRSAEEWEQEPGPLLLWRTRIVTSAVLLLAVLAGAWWVVGWLTSPAGPGGETAPAAAPVLDSSEPAPRSVSPTADPAGSGSVTVHVAGEVREPGLVELPEGSRVADALQSVGGATGEAQLDRLNLAAPATDGSQIMVPGPDIPEAPAATPAPGVAGAGKAGADGAATVNLNTADVTALEELPGIGPALAGRIVDHREQVGPFGSMEDLDAVSGIGPAMMEQLDGLVAW
ncbi:helix-hairpin-helix domain-containing protein [Citricoccus sp. GCM10030269]|uniref:helix-hairpin-helix domain-containing protein n=1 Tax=Citricoccus sp. GCM10030269 TaxID=3273388 RepID=UPI003611B45D